MGGGGVVSAQTVGASVGAERIHGREAREIDAVQEHQLRFETGVREEDFVGEMGKGA
ncbi:MAG: hypothetical protein SNJ74_04495 [Fimbriimonadaceae bacterium]